MASTTLTDGDSAYSSTDGPPPGLTLVYTQDLRRAGEQVVLAGRVAVLLGRDEPLFPGGALADPRMSGRHAALAFDRAAGGGQGAWMIADRGSKNGTFLNGRRITEAPLAAGDVIRMGSTFVVFAPVPCASFEARDVAPTPVLGGIGQAMASVRESILMVGATDHTVLVLGESGSGKEVVARELHRASGRPGPFLAVNCASLRGELLESELFGHVRGAFTGAQRGHDGLFQRADQGTLLLDEVAETEEAVQARLLRVLEARAVRPVGSSEEVPVGTRVIAATNRDVEAAVRAGRLRADLYARLARWTIEVPPLRQRKEDLGVLVRLVLWRDDARLDVTPELMAALLEAPWPLNVRGLVNVLTTARIAQAGVLRLDLVPRVKSTLDAQANLVPEALTEAPPGGLELGSAPGPPAAAAAAAPEPVLDSARVVDALRKHGGNLAAAARALDLTRPSLYRLLVRLGIDPDDYRA
ncbi:MAG: sigma 54-interacting transcriptional regulator [Myxococcota bacterium]